MPLYKRYKSNGKYAYRPMRRVWYKRSGKKALSLARKAMYFVNTEFKHIDSNATSAISSTGDIASLVLLTRGTDDTDRIGNSIKLASLFSRIKFTINASASNTIVRYMFVLDKQPNGAAATVTDVLSVANVVSPLNINHGKRFRILKDKYVQLSASGKQEIMIKFFKKLNIHVEYKSNLGTIADISTNNVFLLLISDEATNTPSVHRYTRMRYIDN